MTGNVTRITVKVFTREGGLKSPTMTIEETGGNDLIERTFKNVRNVVDILDREPPRKASRPIGSPAYCAHCPEQVIPGIDGTFVHDNTRPDSAYDHWAWPKGCEQHGGALEFDCEPCGQAAANA